MITDITNVTKETAMIWWTVSYIAYYPEMYVVKYGTSQDSLTENSDSTYSGEDTTITNKTYSIKLSNLKENTTYYVQVVATNTVNRTNLGSVESFTTSEMESGMNLLCACCRYLLRKYLCLHSQMCTCKRKPFPYMCTLAESGSDCHVRREKGLVCSYMH